MKFKNLSCISFLCKCVFEIMNEVITLHIEEELKFDEEEKNKLINRMREKWIFIIEELRKYFAFDSNKN